MSASDTVLALEIGTSKMQVFVGEIIDGSKINVISLGMSTSGGVKKGDIIDERKAANFAQSAIANAENKASIHSSSVYLAISGSHIKGTRSLGSANVSGANGVVREEDVSRAKDDAKSKAIPDGRSYLHMICCGYYLDGKYCDNPLGQSGSIIEAEYWLVHGESERIASAMHIVESFGMDVKQIVHSALASAMSVTTKKQRDEGVLLIDIGCGTTDYALFRNGRAVQVGTIPVGGDHVTNDISYGLQVSIQNANALKLRYGKITLTPDERASDIWLKGDKAIGDKSFMYASLNKIVCARLEELFNILRHELSEFIQHGQLPPVVLTGGVSKTEGLDALASAVLGVHCENARFADWVKPSLCHHEYATALGLLKRACADSQNGGDKSSKTWFSKLFKI